MDPNTTILARVMNVRMIASVLEGLEHVLIAVTVHGGVEKTHLIQTVVLQHQRHGHRPHTRRQLHMNRRPHTRRQLPINLMNISVILQGSVHINVIIFSIKICGFGITETSFS